MGQYTGALVKWLPSVGDIDVVAYGAPGEPRPEWLPGAVEWRAPGTARAGKLAAIHSRLFAMAPAVAADGVDVFHSPAVHVRPSFPPVARVHCAWVATIHDVIPLSHYGAALPPRVRAFYRWNLRRAAGADRRLTVSQHARREIATHTGIACSAIEVVSSAIEFEPLVDENALQRNGAVRPYLLFAGSYEPRKNLVGTLRAFEKYVAAGGPADLLAITEASSGHARAAHEVLDGLAAPARDRIRLVHDVSQQDLRALYTAADAVVFPSFAEGLGLPPLQAAACGVPVIVSDLPVFTETVGEIAIVADAGDPADLAAAMQRIASEPGIRATAAGRGPEIAAGFRPRRCAESHAEIYRSCVEERDARV